MTNLTKWAASSVLHEEVPPKFFEITQSSLFLHRFEQSQVPLERKLPEDSENGTGFSFPLRLG